MTGAGHGIGLEAARQLAQRGMRGVVTVRDEDKARAAARALEEDAGARDGALLPMALDAAGFVVWSETTSGADLQASRALFDVNLFGTWQVTQALLPLLRRSPHGRVVNVASGAGSHRDTDFGLTTKGGTTASYAISKAALKALTAKLAAEFEGTGLLVNSVDPGLTATAPGMQDMGRGRCLTVRAASYGRRCCPTTGRAAGSSGRAPAPGVARTRNLRGFPPEYR